MKKAKIILASIALLSVVGAAFAFKARTTLGRPYSWTNSYVQGTVTYRAAGNASFCINTTTAFLTNVPPAGASPITTYLTTAPSTTILTLTSGTLTKTIPSYTCVFTSDVYTTNVQ